MFRSATGRTKHYNARHLNCSPSPSPEPEAATPRHLSNDLQPDIFTDLQEGFEGVLDSGFLSSHDHLDSSDEDMDFVEEMDKSDDQNQHFYTEYHPMINSNNFISYIVVSPYL